MRLVRIYGFMFYRLSEEIFIWPQSILIKQSGFLIEARTQSASVVNEKIFLALLCLKYRYM